MSSKFESDYRRVSTAGETRTIVYLKVAEADLAAWLPEGWHTVGIPAGPAKGANLRITFTDQTMALDETGSIVAGPVSASFVVPGVTQSDAAPEPLLVASFTDAPAASCSGAMVVDRAASGSVKRSTTRSEDGRRLVEEDWSIAAPNGERLALEVAYLAGELQYANPLFTIHSAAGPAAERIYRVEQVQDSVMSRPLDFDRTSRLAFAATGPSLSRLFAAGIDIVGIATLPWTRREVWSPLAAVDNVASTPADPGGHPRPA